VCGANLVSAVRAVTVERATNVASGRVRPWRDPRGTTESARTSWHKIRLLRGRFELGEEELLAGDSRCPVILISYFLLDIIEEEVGVPSFF
jgi:hypothetical protein